MVRLIHHHDVPARGERLRAAALIAREQPDAAQHQLIVEKWICLRLIRLDGRAPLLIKQVKPQVEAAQQFHEPLVDQRLRHENQRPPHSPRLEQPMHNQARLNRLAQAHFIRQQNPRSQPPRHLGREIKLMRQQINAPAGEPAHRRLPPTMLMPQRSAAQVERSRRIHHAIEQSLLGPAEGKRVAQLCLTHPPLRAQVGEQARVLDERLHHERSVSACLDLVARTEAHAPQRRVVQRVATRLTGGRKGKRDHAVRERLDGAQSEFGFRLAHPPLARLEQ